MRTRRIGGTDVRRSGQRREKKRDAFPIHSVAGRTCVGVDRPSRDHPRIGGGNGRGRRGCLAGQVLEVGGDGGEVGVGHLRARQRDFLAHDSGRGGDRVVAPLEIGRDIRDAPAPDARIGVGRNIGPDHGAERSLDRPPARIRLARARRIVTARAVANDGEITAALDLAEILRVQVRPDLVQLRATRRDQARGEDERGDRGARDPARELFTHGREARDSLRYRVRIASAAQ